MIYHNMIYYYTISYCVILSNIIECYIILCYIIYYIGGTRVDAPGIDPLSVLPGRGRHMLTANLPTNMDHEQ